MKTIRMGMISTPPSKIACYVLRLASLLQEYHRLVAYSETAVGLCTAPLQKWLRRCCARTTNSDTSVDVGDQAFGDQAFGGLPCVFSVLLVPELQAQPQRRSTSTSSPHLLLLDIHEQSCP
jgi:hypothetical protein